MDIGFRDLGLEVGDGKWVLSGVNGDIKNGNLTAIMGPSGCGKSSFLTTLAGLSFYGTRHGKIFVNGKESALTKYKRLVGFVPQEDIMIRTMTVEETLYFSARTRLPGTFSNNRVKKIVQNTIKILRLEDIRDSVIGDEKNRGISGGQRKRVNIGMELVVQPSVLLLDEPTSGLDSTSSFEVCNVLREIAESGINVITVIHQPRYEIFNLFHQILLLAKGGKTVYLGPTEKVAQYFEKIGFICPPKTSPSDFYLDIISGRPQLLESGTESNSNLHEYDPQDLPLKWEKFIEDGGFESQDISKDTPQDSQSAQFDEPHMSWSSFVMNTIYQYHMCIWRPRVQFIRDMSGFFLDNMLVWISGFFLAVTLFNEIYIGSPEKKISDMCPGDLRKLCEMPVNDPIIRLATLLPLCMSLTAVTASISQFGREDVIFKRESMSGLSPLAYFVGKNLIQILNILIAPMVFLCIFFSLAQPQSSLLQYYWMLVVFHFSSYGLGYLISTIFPSNIQTLAGVVVILITHMFSGAQLLLPQMEEMMFPFSVIPNLSYIRWMIEAIYITEVQHFDDLYDITKGLKLFGYRLDRFGQCMALVAMYGFLFRIFALILLWSSKPDSYVQTARRYIMGLRGKFRSLLRKSLKSKFKGTK